MKTNMILACLVLVVGLAQPVPTQADLASLEKPDDPAPAQDQEEPSSPEETGEPGRTTAGASVSSSGSGVGVTSRRDRFFFGGGVGLSFGDIKFVEIWPLFGYNFNPKVRGGMTLTYRYRKDERFPDNPSTTDYGASLFVDYFPVPRFFLRGEYEHLNYEFVNFDLTTDREAFNSFFGGVGFANPIGSNGALNIMVLYNFSYDSDDPFSPYADPYVFRIGVSFGF